MILKIELTSHEKKIIVFLLSLLLIGATLTLINGKVPLDKPPERVKN